MNCIFFPYGFGHTVNTFKNVFKTGNKQQEGNVQHLDYSRFPGPYLNRKQMRAVEHVNPLCTEAQMSAHVFRRHPGGFDLKRIVNACGVHAVIIA